MQIDDHDLLKWLWAMLTIPLAWIWARVASVSRKADETRITLAERHYTKLEVVDLVDRSVKPLHDKLNEIGSDVKHITRKLGAGDS